MEYIQTGELTSHRLTYTFSHPTQRTDIVALMGKQGNHKGCPYKQVICL